MAELSYSRRNILKTALFGAVASREFSGVAAADDIVAEDQLIARWPFEEEFADVVGDNSASADHGNPTVESFDGRNAVAFDGDDGLRVSSGENEDLVLMGEDHGPVTFSMWVYLDEKTGEDPEGNSEYPSHTLLRNDTNYVISVASVENEGSVSLVPRFRITDVGNSDAINYSTDSESTDELSLNKWHHLSFVANSTNYVRIYIDGELAFSDDSVDGYNDGAEDYWSDITIGSWYGRSSPVWANLMNGKISDLRIYDKELSNSGVETIYDNKSGESNGNPAVSMFQQVKATGRSRLLLALAGLGTAGGTYVGYKKLSDTEDSIESNTSTDSDRSIDTQQDTDLIISAYGEIQLGETIRETFDYQLQEGQNRDHHFWVLKPSLEDAETVSTAVFKTFNESVDPWTGMDSHPNLVSVFGTGSEPVPWVAIEDADDPELVEQVDSLSMAKTVEALQEVCEALHHVHRYGTTYENLTTGSVLYTDDEGVKLRGVLDQFEEHDPWYNTPEEFDDESTEQSTVYRVGLIAYELLTGTLPYPTYPNGNSKSTIQSHELISPSEQVATLPEEVDEILLTALSADPVDRYETVLHLRDELSKI